MRLLRWSNLRHRNDDRGRGLNAQRKVRLELTRTTWENNWTAVTSF